MKDLLEKLGITPGPWKYTRQSHSPNWLDLMLTTEDDAKIIGWIYNDHEADARLIAAAPEMLEALIESTTLLKEIRIKYGTSPSEEGVIDKNMRVIEKATGGMLP